MKEQEYKHTMAKLTNSVAVCFIGSEDAVTNSITYPVTRDARSIRALELICCALWSNSKVGADSWICRVWISTAVKGSWQLECLWYKLSTPFKGNAAKLFAWRNWSPVLTFWFQEGTEELFDPLVTPWLGNVIKVWQTAWGFNFILISYEVGIGCRVEWNLSSAHGKWAFSTMARIMYIIEGILFIHLVVPIYEI